MLKIDFTKITAEKGPSRMGKLTDSYNLETINPTLSKQWHPTKNGDLTTRAYWDVTKPLDKAIKYIVIF